MLLAGSAVGGQRAERPRGFADATGVPRLVKFSGVVAESARPAREGQGERRPFTRGEVQYAVGLTFAIYAEQEGGTALWQETQNVALDEQGRYSVLLGAASREGLPAELFASGEPRWLGVQAQVPGAGEGARVLLVSVPYALRADDAASLGGRPATDYMLREQMVGWSAASQAMSASAAAAGGSQPVVSGTVNFVGKFTPTGADVGNSQIFDNGINVGIGTTSPAGLLDIQLTTNTNRNSLNTTVTLNNASAITGAVISALNMQLVDASTANNLSKQSARMVYIRDAAATGGVLAFDSIFTTSAFLNANAPYQLRGANFEFPRVLAGRTLNTYIGLYMEAPQAGGGTTTNAFALVTEPGAGNVGINTTSPLDPLHVVGVVRATGGVRFNDGSLQTTATTPGVTSVTAGAGLTGGTITGTGTVAFDTTFGDARYLRLSGGTLTGGLSGTSATLAGTFTGTTGTFSGNTTTTNSFVVQSTQAGSSTTQSSITNPPPAALRGATSPATGHVAGVLGITSSTEGIGVAGANTNPAAGNNAVGVVGIVNGTTAIGVVGENTSTGAGLNWGMLGTSSSTNGTGVQGEALALTGDAWGVWGTTESNVGIGVRGDANATSGFNAGVLGAARSPNGVGVAATNLTTAGGPLFVGFFNSANVFRVDHTGRGFFNGGQQTGGADFAESVEPLGEKAAYAPGDVLVIDPTGRRRVALSQGAYATNVAGVYSTKPGVLATEHSMDDPRIASEVPLAVIGIVPCKVSAENGAIRTGDLLVTSAVPGHAMRGSKRGKMLGAVVGKALEPFDPRDSKGRPDRRATGTILVLVTLQ
jgi:hypothetical protein